jgi:hypothetical protein
MSKRRLLQELFFCCFFFKLRWKIFHLFIRHVCGSVPKYAWKLKSQNMLCSLNDIFSKVIITLALNSWESKLCIHTITLGFILEREKIIRTFFLGPKGHDLLTQVWLYIPCNIFLNNNQIYWGFTLNMFYCIGITLIKSY